MTFQPDLTKPDQQQQADLLVSQVAKLGISVLELQVLAKYGHLKEVDEVYGLSWWINGKRVLGWNSSDQRFEVPSLKEG